ncbi:SURF1 family protein [Pseudooceanicola sp. C21-150M6]|uniref:SURF1 family protein n=1 Tax=Pseudooceanicola sp. C21-150M6 TaxID=3434355 RepID=UPI003D7FB0FA
MNIKLIGALVIGLGGAAMLVSLGSWQLRRLDWKEAILTEIETRIADAPVQLPATPDAEADTYLPVTVTGRFDSDTLRVLTSQKQIGAGYRLITGFDLGDRRIMVDRGFLPEGTPAPALPEGQVTVTGNLHWPDETDGFTPEPDLKADLWFARDVQKMAGALTTDPVLLVAKDTSFDPGPVSPLPVGTEGIPNDHLQYAITWFSLAAIWLAMTGLLVYRTVRPAKGKET